MARESFYIGGNSSSFQGKIGLDGFTFAKAFSQECWDIVKEVMLKVFSKFCNCRVICKSTNATSIALVP